MNRIKRKQEKARVDRYRAEMQPALEASLAQRKAAEQIQSATEEADMTQPAYTPPPAPGVLPDGKRVFVCTDHAGHYPVGVASVIIADSEVQARGLLEEELRTRGLNPDEPFTLQEVTSTDPRVVVLNDGNY